MNSTAPRIASRSTSYLRRIAAAFMGCGVVALALAAPRLAFAQVLTGITLFSSTASGQVTDAGNNPPTDIWNTVGGDNKYNLWVSLAGTAINGPLDAGAGINQILTTPGTYNFTIFGNPGFNQANHGMNLFFGDNAVSPAISIYAPTASATTEIPAFFANSQTTVNLSSGLTQGAGNVKLFHRRQYRDADEVSLGIHHGTKSGRGRGV